MKILFVYSYSNYPPQQSIHDYIYAFKKHSGHQVYYLNLFFPSLASFFLRKMEFDAVFFHETLSKAADYKIQDYINRLQKFDFSKTLRIGFFQDEWFDTNAKCHFINSLGIDYIFTCTTEENRKEIYDKVTRSAVRYFTVLPGYVSEQMLQRIEQKKNSVRKTIDIGYRASVTPKSYYYGSYYLNKRTIGEVMNDACKKSALVTDISANPADNIRGEAWFDFLLQCKYVLGIDGGVNILHRDNSVEQLTFQYLSRHPGASFEEVKENCFKQLDGNIRYHAISPRHFEAIMTGTCQILLEGDYSGILKPGVHYIELKKDYSNVQEVIRLVQEDTLRETIAARAYRDVIQSQKYTYRAFVGLVMRSIGFSAHTQHNELLLREKTILQMVSLLDKMNWVKAWFFSQALFKVYKAASRVIPSPLLLSLRKFLKV